MLKRVLTINAAFILTAAICLGAANAREEHPIMEKIAEKIVHKYKTISCEELREEHGHKKTAKKEEMEERVVHLLREDAELRKAFLDRVAAPIADKLIECGLVP